MDRRTFIALIAAPLVMVPAKVSRAAGPLLFHDHGHGLAFSPDGKALLAPSHSGLAAYEDGDWWEAPGPVQGFSGFSVAEHAIYASGHAGLPQSTPAGLLRSDDGGRTWRALALAGEADFHLVAAGYRSSVIYVLNTQPNPAMPGPGLYATTDEGKTWRRAAAIGLSDRIHGLAAHPADPAIVAVAADGGLYLSRDGGEKFRRLDSSGAVTALAFDFAGERLRYARALSNEVLETSLDGRERRALRLPPLPGDFVTCLAQNPKDARMLAAATRRRDVYLSADGGVTWRQTASQGQAQPGSAGR